MLFAVACSSAEIKQLPLCSKKVHNQGNTNVTHVFGGFNERRPWIFSSLQCIRYMQGVKKKAWFRGLQIDSLLWGIGECKREILIPIALDQAAERMLIDKAESLYSLLFGVLAILVSFLLNFFCLFPTSFLVSNYSVVYSSFCVSF